MRIRRALVPVVAAAGLALALSAPTAVADPIAAAPVGACLGEVTAIPAIQGSGPAAAITGPVTARGVVVGDYEGPSPALRGFYLQDLGDDDPATSDAIFVFNNVGGGSPNSVALGDVVQVSGTAAEFQDQTQISATAVQACGVTDSVHPVDVRLPLAAPEALERFEGMLVRFDQRLTVTEHFQLGRFGQVVVSSHGRLLQPTAVFDPDDPRSAELAAANALNRLIIDDALQNQNPDPIVLARGRVPDNPLSAANTLRAGDTVNDAVGVLTYTWAGNAASGNAFRLRPVGALGGSARFVAANDRPDGAPRVGGDLRAASANLLNYFVDFTGCTLGVGGAPTGCRGAQDAVEFGRQQAKTIAALTALDADVLAVNELQNDGYGPDSSLQDLRDRLNAAQGPGTWAFVDADAETGVLNVAGTDAIRTALLYRPASVQPVPGTTFVAQSATFERRPLAQTFTTADGEWFSVVANHFKSKSCTGATGADLDAGDGQGCFNARRVAQARELASFVETAVIPGAGDPDVLVIGDLNSYAQEDPIAALAAAGYTDLVAETAGSRPYSFGFDGQWGYLDYAMVSPSLRPQMRKAREYHINADEPSVLDYNTNFKSPGQVVSLFAPDEFRASDHDPLLVGLRLRD